MNAFLKLQQIRGILRGIERSRLKTPEKVTCVVYLHVILFGMHEKNTATEKEFDTVLYMTLEYFLTQRFKQSTKWTAKVNNINKYV